MSEYMDPVEAAQYLVMTYADLRQHYQRNAGLEKAIVTAIAALSRFDPDVKEIDVKDLI